MKKFFSKLVRFWNEDRSLTIMLLLLLLFIFVFVPILNPGRGGQVFLTIVYSVMLLTGILSVMQHKKYVTIISTFAVIGVFANCLSDVEPTKPILIANDFGAILFNFFFAIAI